MTENHVAGVNDPAGLETLELFANTGHFNSWLFETLAPFCKDPVLEIGSGIGNISAYLAGRYQEVYLSDVSPGYCKLLQDKFKTSQQVKDVYFFDLGEPAIEKTNPVLVNKFDSIIASNVVEHIREDSLAIRNCHTMLRPGGHAVILVPAYSWLYNSFDKELGHFRRYTKKGLTGLLTKQGFKVIHTQYFNAAGMLGWWVSGSVLKKKILPKNQLSLYNKLIPVFRLVDKMLMKRCGLSVIAVGEKI